MMKKSIESFWLLLFLGATALSGLVLVMPRMQLLIVAMLLPLVGMVLRPGKSAGFVGLFFLLKWFLCGIMPVTFGIPTACAASSWSLYSQQGYKAELIRLCLNLLLPIACMLLFVAHPVGKAAFAYSLFWIIPIAIYFIHLFFNCSLFLVALASSFIAHAVGSVMWLYLIPIPPERWIALIPIVAIERLCIAVGGVLVYRSLSGWGHLRRNSKESFVRYILLFSSLFFILV